MKALYYSIAAIAVSVSHSSYAQQTSQTTTLDEIVVSGGLTPIEARKSGRTVTVISADTLEKNQIKYVSEALRLVPGIAVSRSGGTGGITQLRMRGGESNHTLIVIDGVAVNDINDGIGYLENLLTSEIEQIEILRGPQSALWGSNAMSGVINITTKEGNSGKSNSSISTEFGTDKSWLTNLATRGGNEAVRYALNGSLRNTTGFNIATIGDEDDRNRIGTINGKLSLDLSDATTLDTTVRYVDRKSNFDETDYVTAQAYDADNYLTDKSISGTISLKNQSLEDALTQRLDLTARRQDRSDIGSGWTSGSEATRYTAGYSASYRYDEIEDQSHQVTGAYEWLQETYQSDNMSASVSRNTHSATAEYRGEFHDRFFITAGLRREWNSTFDDNITWNVSGDWRLPELDLRLHSAIGTAVTKPTFIEQLGWGNTFIGNPNLKPEKSFGWDIGIEKTALDGGLIVDLTYFNQNLTNEISGSGNTVINNDGEGKNHGIELSATVDFFNGLTGTASYTYTDATSQSSSNDPRVQSLRRPKHSGSVTAAYVFAEDKARVFTEIVMNGAMIDNAFPLGRVPLKGYTVVNIGGSYKVNDNLDVFSRIENLFDKDYAEVYGYNTPGVTAFVGVKASF